MEEHPADAMPLPVQVTLHADESSGTAPAALEISSDVASARRERTPAPRFEPTPIASEPAHEAPMPRDAPDLPRVSLELPADSGLVLVETSHDRVPAVHAQEEPEGSRPRRVRPPRPETHEEPLQMVETSHKDSTPPGE
jgi:hypothetical protein